MLDRTYVIARELERLNEGRPTTRVIHTTAPKPKLQPKPKFADLQGEAESEMKRRAARLHRLAMLRALGEDPEYEGRPMARQNTARVIRSTSGLRPSTGRL